MAGFSRAIVSSFLGLSCIFFSFSKADRTLLVGGKTDAWKIPTSSQSDSLNHWAQNSRFIIGDSLVWKYDASKDSVLQVSKRDYVTCNTSSPIASYSDGNTQVKLEHSGPYYFISGAEGHCQKGQKMIVVVISEKHRLRFMAGPSSAPSSPVQFLLAPAPAPTSSAADMSCSLLLMAFWAALMGFFFLV